MPFGEAVVKRSGAGITITCVCGERVQSGTSESTLTKMRLAVAAHGRIKAEQAAIAGMR